MSTCIYGQCHAGFCCTVCGRPFDGNRDRECIGAPEGGLPKELAIQKPCVGCGGRSQSTCIHRGEETGETILCTTCAGRKDLKVFTCDVFGTCTVGKKVDWHACCKGCDRFTVEEANRG